MPVFSTTLDQKQTMTGIFMRHLFCIWGSGVESQSVILRNSTFPVSENLYAALWYARDESLDRIY